jgi:hypothetical protein
MHLKKQHQVKEAVLVFQAVKLRDYLERGFQNRSLGLVG